VIARLARVPLRAVFVGAMAVAVLVTVAVLIGGGTGDHLEGLVGRWQNTVARTVSAPAALAGWRLYAVAFVGGLAASLSPCILGMLPVNLSYIGASGIASRTRAVTVAGAFVAGVVLVNIAIGLVSSLFFSIVVEYRAPINMAVGVLMVVMGLWLGGVLRLRVPQLIDRMPTGAGPFIVGLVFALVASPCASPVLVAVLAVATRDGSPVRATVAMAFYAVGYTVVLFLASLFAGVALASRQLLRYGEALTRAGAVMLVAFGVFTFAYGLRLR